MARPTVPKEQRRSRSVSYRLTEAEYAQLCAAATRANLRPGDFARLTALAKGERLIVKTYAKNDPALLAQLHKIGINLNQLVHNAHIFGRVSPHIERLCQQIEALIAEAAAQEWERR